MATCTTIDISTLTGRKTNATIVEINNSLKSARNFYYWRQKLMIVSSPFVLFGFPIHIIFDLPYNSSATTTILPNHSKSHNNNNSVLHWLTSVARNQLFHTSIVSCISTVLLAFVTALWTLFTASNLYILFYNLVILGQLDFSQISSSLLNLFYIIPPLLPILFCWAHGYQVKELSQMFDQFKPHLLQLAYINNNEVNPYHLRPAKPLAYIKCKLITFYSIIYFIFSLQIVIDYCLRYVDIDISSNSNNNIIMNFMNNETELISTTTTTITTTNSIQKYLLNDWILFYFVDTMYLSTLPIYSILCWALLAEIQLISVYLRSLRIYGLRPSVTIFEQIKYCYKSIAKHILIVNRLCRFLIGWIILIILGFVMLNVIFGLRYLIEPFYVWFMDFFFGWKNTEDNNDRSDQHHQDSHVLVNDYNETTVIEESSSTISIFGLYSNYNNHSIVAPQFVRGSVGYLTVAFLKICLLGYTYWQAVKVNDQFRFLHILLNDFITNSNVAAASTELYRAFQLLKLYVHSTMEYQSPSLLRIPILTCFPYFGKRLHKYNQKS